MTDADPFRLPGLGDEPTGPERLQKVLARAGVASRRVVEDMIRDGRVSVNGRVATLGDKADPDSDEISVDGAVISVMPDAVTYLLNKPAGTVSTSDDPQGRPTVVSLVPVRPPGVSRRAAGLRHRGFAPPHQRWRNDSSAHPSVPRRRKGVSGPRRRFAQTGCTSNVAKGS